MFFPSQTVLIKKEHNLLDQTTVQNELLYFAIIDAKKKYKMQSWARDNLGLSV